MISGKSPADGTGHTDPGDVNSMSSYLLSICLPTYNHRKFIVPLLESIVPQLTDRVEVVISNNASTDDTEEACRPFFERFSNIRYFKNDKNLGPDGNFVKVVQRARGKYCWIVGSDDLLMPIAIATLLKKLASNRDIYLFDFNQHNKHLKYLRTIRLLKKGKPGSVFDLSKRSQLLAYLRGNYSHMGLFSFISAYAFKRDRWLSAKGYEPFLGSYFIQSYFMLSMVKDGATLEHIEEPFMINRIGNEHPELFPGDPVGRVLADIHAFSAYATLFFGNDPEVRSAVLRILRSHRNWKHIAKLRAESAYPVWRKDIEPALHKAGYGTLLVLSLRYGGSLISLAWNIAKPLVDKYKGRR